jgi:dimethylglycine dehydrogenase
VTFDVDAADANVIAYKPIFINGKVLGFCTSGGFSHHTGKSIAFGLIQREHVIAGLEVEIEILGSRHHAILITKPIF